MANLPLGAPYIPPLTNAPTGFLTASTAGNGRLLDAWTGTQTVLYGSTMYLSTQGGAATWRGGNISTIIDTILATAQSAGLTMVRPTDFFDDHTPSQRWDDATVWTNLDRSEEHTSELQSHSDLVCRLLLEQKKKNIG